MAQGIGTTVSIIDNVSSPIQAMLNNVNRLIDSFTLLSHSYTPPTIPAPTLPTIPTPDPVEVPISWDTSGVEVFTNTGIDRFQSEMASANSMMQQLTTTQQNISNTASNMTILPPAAQCDISNLTTRISEIQQRIQQIEANPLNMGTDTANRQIEQLRGQLNQAVQAQNSLNAALESADADAILNSYNQLNSTVGNVEQNIRDNVNAQNQFNDTVAQGETRSDGLLKKIAGIAAAYIGFNVIKDQVGQAIEYASDLTESQNVVDVAFGESAEKINAWSKTTLEAFGLNELSAKQYSGTMAAMLKSSGMAGEQVDKMSMGVTELAGDMASFYNLDSQTAFDKIRAGLSGETEPLNQLGINMSVARLEAYAMSQGIQTAYADMDQASQTALRYNYLLQATADAQGDFARTSDSYANQTKLLSENWKAFTGELASNALPILAQIIAGLNGFIGNMTAYIPTIVAFGGTIFDTLAQVLSIVGEIGTFIGDNWSVIEPIVLGIAAALGIYVAALVAYNAIQAISAGITAAKTFATTVHAAALAMETGSTFAATAAQSGFNAALLACPITWIVLLIIALVAALFMASSWIAKTTGAASSGFGIIAGGLSALVAIIGNVFKFIGNVFVGIWEAGGAVASNLGTAFHNTIANIQSWFYGLLSTVISVITGIVNTINKLPFVDIDTSGLESAATDYANKQAAAESSKEEYKDVGAAFSDGMDTIDYSNIGDAFDAGAKWGDGVSEQVGNALDFSNITDMLSGGSGETSGNESGYNPVDASYNAADTAANTAANTASTAASSAATAENTSASEEDLKYLKEIAERDVINRFTTAEIKLDVTNNNNVSSDMDIDGIVQSIGDKLTDMMLASAEAAEA